MWKETIFTEVKCKKWEIKKITVFSFKIQKIKCFQSEESASHPTCLCLSKTSAPYTLGGCLIAIFWVSKVINASQNYGQSFVWAPKLFGPVENCKFPGPQEILSFGFLVLSWSLGASILKLLARSCTKTNIVRSGAKHSPPLLRLGWPFGQNLSFNISHYI